MVSDADLSGFRAANERVAELLTASLASFWSSLDLDEFDGVRADVLDVTPVLVGEYGGMSAALAAEFFEDAVDAQPVLGDGLNPAQVDASARWAIGPLWEGGPGKALTQLTASLVRHVHHFGRETIHDSTRATRGVRYARVPGDLCPYCVELASRGLVFGADRGMDGMGFHDSCTCLVIPSRSEADLPPSYDLPALRALHAQHRAEGLI